MKFCQIDKISTRTCISDDAEILLIGQAFSSNCKQTPTRNIFGAKLLFLSSGGIKRNCAYNYPL